MSDGSQLHVSRVGQRGNGDRATGVRSPFEFRASFVRRRVVQSPGDARSHLPVPQKAIVLRRDIDSSNEISPVSRQSPIKTRKSVGHHVGNFDINLETYTSNSVVWSRETLITLDLNNRGMKT